MASGLFEILSNNMKLTLSISQNVITVKNVNSFFLLSGDECPNFVTNF